MKDPLLFLDKDINPVRRHSLSTGLAERTDVHPCAAHAFLHQIRTYRERPEQRTAPRLTGGTSTASGEAHQLNSDILIGIHASGQFA